MNSMYKILLKVRIYLVTTQTKNYSFSTCTYTVRERIHDYIFTTFQCIYYSVGVNDFTRCFFCAGGLRDWEPNDNPWIEHARWYENCVFVRQCKGEEFMQLVKQGKILEATQIVRIISSIIL